MCKILTSKKIGKFFCISFFGAFMALLFLSESPSAKAACNNPGQILDLTNCKQTLPTGKSGSPTEIFQPALNSYVADPYFHTNSTCDGVVFRAPVNGVTTSNSGYPRSELREMTNAGKDKASWSTTSGTHTMFIDQAITAVPKNKKHIVAGQIHDADDDVIVIRLEFPKLFVDINGQTGPTLDANYTLGKRFTVKFVTENGQIKIYYNGSQNPAHTMNKSTSGCYFKAGAYTQSNCSKETDCSSNNFGEVVIYKLALNGQIIVPKPVVTEPVVEPVVIPAVSPEPTPINSLTFEAEGGIVTAPMQIISDSTASEGKYVVQKTYTGTGSVKYVVNIPNTGKYQLRAKVISPDGSSNSFYYSLDSKSSKSWNLPDTIKTWTWVNGDSIDLTQGTHILEIKKREKNTKLDMLELKPVTLIAENSLIDGTIPFEAEIGLASKGMHIFDNVDASEGKYVQADSSGLVSYKLNIPVSGTYRLAGWIKALNGSSDSFSFSIDGKPAVTWTLGYPTSSWTYDIDDRNTFSLTAGVHTLAIKYREVGAKIDRVALIKQ